MNFFRRLFAPLFSVIIAVGLLTSASAQIGETPQSLNAQATNEMKAGNWEAALSLLNTCVQRFDGRAMTLFGPQFGVTWYRKGICELKLKQFEAAMESFETCYTKYPNNAEQAQSGGNPFNKQALLRWGEAAQGAEEWEKALNLYEKYLIERDKTRDAYNPGSLYLNLAACNFQLGKLEDGIKHFETALQNKVRFKVSDASIISVFQTFVKSVIAKKDEKALLSFIADNRAALVIEPYEMVPYTKLFLSLAGETYNADMEQAAFVLYQLIPGTSVMLDDVNSRIGQLATSDGFRDGSRTVSKDRLLDSRKDLEQSARSGDPHEVIQLRATAFLHEQHGNIRGAYAAYDQLERFFVKSQNREDNLYNLVRTSSLLSKTGVTEEVGNRFLAAFPESKHVPAVRRLLLTSIFYAGKYETVIQIASEMLPRLQPGTMEHDICLHVLGGSYYYTGDYESAQPLLDQHVTAYPESSFALAAMYFQASNEGRRQYWLRAAKLLDAFLEKYPDETENVFLPLALYDRANAHYALDENDAALVKLNRIETEFPNADVMAVTMNLKGNVLQSEDMLAESEVAYQKALEIAERRGDKFVAAESLNYLVGLLGQRPKTEADSRLKDAVSYADRFWKEYSNSPYKAQVAVSQMLAMKDAGRSEEALNRLRDVISEMAGVTGAPYLEEAIGSYTEAYLDENTPDELKEHYYNFPNIRSENKAARALLRIAVIGVFEDQINNSGGDEQKKIQAEAGIKVLFRDLKNEFALSDLSNFILVRVGDFIRGTNSAREALPYYTEALDREDKSYRFRALFGRSAILANGSAAEKKEAVKDFERVLEDSEDRSERDDALSEMVSLQLEMGDYKSAIKNAKLYLDRQSGYSKKKPEVALMLGQAYERANMKEDALLAYLNANNSYTGKISTSAPALASYMELLWERNKAATASTAADRQFAYNQGRAYIDATRRLTDRFTDEELAQWRNVEALVERYVSDPSVLSKEQQEVE